MNKTSIPLKADKVEFGLFLSRLVGETFSSKGNQKPFIGICISHAPICDDKYMTKNGSYRSYKIDVINPNTLRIERWDMRRCAIVTDPESKVFQQLSKFKDSETFKVISQGKENRNFSDLKSNVF